MFKLVYGETAEQGSKRLMLERIDQNVEFLTDRQPTLDIAIHESRKNLKRMRAVLRLIRGEIGDEHFKPPDTLFRDTSRILSPLRDGSVMLETIDKLKLDFALDEATFSTTRHWLQDRYSGTRERFLENQSLIHSVLETLRISRKAVAGLPFANTDFDAFAEGLHRVYRRGENRFRVSYTNESEPDRFHDWRKRVKYLWYQVEMLSDLWPVVTEELVRELRQLSQYLGDDNDLAVLHATISRGAQHLPDYELKQLGKYIQQRRLQLQRAAYPLGQRLYAEPADSFVGRFNTYWDVWQTYRYNGLPPHKFALDELPNRFLTTGEVASRLNISTARVRQLIANGQLQASKIGRQWLVPPGAVEALNE